MEQDRFAIIFTKLTEAVNEQVQTEGTISPTEQLQAESEEIAELCRLVRETTEPERRSYTTT